jgi:AraC family transcriptional regulator
MILIWILKILILLWSFNNGLPDSQYLLDKRPHFEILGKKYKHNHPNSQEEVWIPIKEK